MLYVKSVDEVFGIIKDNFSEISLGNEPVEIKDALGRITASDITAMEDVPGFIRSSVDGYAVAASDTFGAGDSMPAQLDLAGEVKMGVRPGFILQGGQAAYIPTGGELPENADAVVMVEYTENFNDGYIYINKSAAPGSNVVFKGDDVRKGEIVLKAGRSLRPQDIGVAAAVGCSRIDVKRKLRVGIISTGDEVVDINEEVIGARVRDINSHMLYSGIMEYGAESWVYGIVNDSYEKIRGTVGLALKECDMVLISGGSSVGTRDETCKVISSFGEPGILVHGIAVKPGKPAIVGKVEGKAVFGLPGHPASAWFVFKIFVCNLLDILNGLKQKIPHRVQAEMTCNYPSNTGREEFVPVKLEMLDGRLSAQPVFGKSGLITLLSSADGYVRISRGAEGINKGKQVEVILF